jgi:hypothetical protein
MKDAELIDQFVASFEKLDEMSELRETNPIAWELRVSEPNDEWKWFEWRASKIITDRSHLDAVYQKIPARFPPLYEQLVLSYRWAEIDIESCRLLPNPSGPDLSRLLKEIERDPAIWENLIPAGYIQFGRGPDMDYDPVCFEIKSRSDSKDYRIVKIDHEEILCNNRVRVVGEVALSFRQLVLAAIESAAQKK